MLLLETTRAGRRLRVSRSPCLTAAWHASSSVTTTTSWPRVRWGLNIQGGEEPKCGSVDLDLDECCIAGLHLHVSVLCLDTGLSSFLVHNFSVYTSDSPLSLCVYTCLSLCLRLSLLFTLRCLCISFSVSVSLFHAPYVSLSLCLSVFLSPCLSTCLSTCLASRPASRPAFRRSSM